VPNQTRQPLMPSIDQIVEDFKIFLEVKYPAYLEKFVQRLAANPEAARAEAIVFSFLRSQALNPLPSEDLSSGGMDFLCHQNGKPSFFLETTSFGSETAANASGISTKIPESASASWYKTITKQLRRIVSEKARQLSAQVHPCVLAITTEHYSAEALLGTQAAVDMLIGETKIAFSVGTEESKSNIITELEDSVFFRRKKDGSGIESWRRNISAILLFQIYSKECRIVGLLHPDPTKPFSIDLLPEIPFIRLQTWPPKDGKLDTEWVISNPSATQFYHQSIALTDVELKQN